MPAAVSLAAKLGVPIRTGLIGNPANIPVEDSAPQLGFVTEGSAFTPADPHYTNKFLSPKIGGIVSSISPISLQQPDALSIVQGTLTRAGAAGLDRAVFVGSGSGGQPTGIWTGLSPI